MDEKRIIIGIVAVGTLLPQLLGCIWGPECLPTDTAVTLTADRSVGVGSLTTVLTARANGSNTCGEMPTSTEIVEFRWDLDGDGVFEARDTSDRFRLTFDEPGEHVVNVEVEDSDGITVRGTTTLEVLEAFDPQEALDRVSVWIVTNVSFDCTDQRPICAYIDSPLDIETDVTIRAVHDDGAVAEETHRLLLGPDELTELCIEAGMAAADVTVDLRAGGAFVSENAGLEEGYQPAECRP